MYACEQAKGRPVSTSVPPLPVSFEATVRGRTPVLIVLYLIRSQINSPEVHVCIVRKLN